MLTDVIGVSKGWLLREPVALRCLSVSRGDQIPMGYNCAMKRKPLSETNPHLRDPVNARRQTIRSVASSTAIETGKPVREIEARLIHLAAQPSRVTLA